MNIEQLNFKAMASADAQFGKLEPRLRLHHCQSRNQGYFEFMNINEVHQHTGEMGLACLPGTHEFSQGRGAHCGLILIKGIRASCLCR